MAFVRLEPCDANVSSTVLKGLGTGNRPLLLGVRPAGRTFLEVKVLYTPGKGKC
jgi:hypothetical protein